MNYTKENIQGIVFKVGAVNYIIDFHGTIATQYSKVGSYWLKRPNEMITHLKTDWVVIEWPLKPSEINNNYELY